MKKLDDDVIKKINSYWEEVSDSEIGRQLGIRRQTVAKYRTQIVDTLTKEEKQKQELVRTYTPEELKDILTHLQTHTSREVEKVIWEKWHLRFALLADTHLGNKMAAKKELEDFYRKAGKEWVEAFIHCGDLVDGTGNVFKGQVYELEDVGYDEQLKTTVEDYPY